MIPLHLLAKEYGTRPSSLLIPHRPGLHRLVLDHAVRYLGVQAEVRWQRAAHERARLNPPPEADTQRTRAGRTIQGGLRFGRGGLDFAPGYAGQDTIHLEWRREGAD